MGLSFAGRTGRRKAARSVPYSRICTVRPEKALGSSWMKGANQDNDRESCSVEAEVQSNLHSLSASTHHPLEGAQTAGRNASEPRCSLVMLNLDGTNRWYYGEVSSFDEGAVRTVGTHSGVTGVACRKDPSVNRGGPKGTRGLCRQGPLATASYKGNRSGSGSSWESEGPIRALNSVQQNTERAKGPYFGVLVKQERGRGLP